VKQRFEFRCAQLGVTAAQVAEHAGLTPSQVSSIINSKTDPRVSTLTQLADALGVTIAWLCGPADAPAVWQREALDMMPPEWTPGGRR